jgi:hypothetical protein
MRSEVAWEVVDLHHREKDPSIFVHVEGYTASTMPIKVGPVMVLGPSVASPEKGCSLYLEVGSVGFFDIIIENGSFSNGPRL